MERSRRSRLKTIFHRAEGLRGDERAAYLVRACADDAELRREVERLLEAAERTPESFLQPPEIDRGTSSVPLGDTVGHYRILESLGAGGMGEVYLAEDSRLKRRVALKVLPSEFAEQPERLHRFQREAETVAALNHPGIVTIHSVEEAGGVHFLTMELVEGETLAGLIPDQGLPWERFLSLSLPITEAVARGGSMRSWPAASRRSRPAASPPRSSSIGSSRPSDAPCVLTPARSPGRPAAPGRPSPVCASSVPGSRPVRSSSRWSCGSAGAGSRAVHASAPAPLRSRGPIDPASRRNWGWRDRRSPRWPFFRSGT